jgi:MFS family permease
MSTLTLSTPTPAQPERPTRTGDPVPRARLVSGRLAVLLMCSFGALTSFYLLLSVTPMYAVSAGAGGAEAGLVTGALMLATVLAEFASAGLMKRCGNRTVFAAGALLLGGPALALLTPRSLVTIFAVSLVRGAGFGLNTVVTGALVATALPPERRGEGLGLSGVVACVPAVVALPSGVWLAVNTSYAVVIAITAAAALAPLAAIPWLPGAADHGEMAADPSAVEPGTGQPGTGQPDTGQPGTGQQGTGQPTGLLAGLRPGGLLRPSLIFAATTVSAGVVVAFLPLAAGVSGGVATLGLFVQALTSTASRWWAGRHGDRHGHAALLIPALLTASAGMTVLIWVANPAAVIAGMCLFGIGFGISQNATFAVMIDRMPVSGYGTASALWNLAYDAGYGAGPAAFGLFVAHTGYPAAFALTGMLMLAALRPAWRERSAGGHGPRWPRRAARVRGHRA